jgi:diamine N-acetyltransferase
LSTDNVAAVNNLTLKPGQERFIVPFTYTMSGMVPAASWQRVVLRDGDVGGFIHGGFDAAADSEEFRACIWQINIDAAVQGHGVGTFAIDACAGEALARGFDHITVMWEPGTDGPEAAFLRMGFTEVGETLFGDIIGEL